MMNMAQAIYPLDGQQTINLASGFCPFCKSERFALQERARDYIMGTMREKFACSDCRMVWDEEWKLSRAEYAVEL